TAPVDVDRVEPRLVAQAGAEGKGSELDPQAPQVGGKLHGPWTRAGRGAEEERPVRGRAAGEQGCGQGRLLTGRDRLVAVEPLVGRQPDHAVRLHLEPADLARRDLDE